MIDHRRANSYQTIGERFASSVVSKSLGSLASSIEGARGRAQCETLRNTLDTTKKYIKQRKKALHA